MKGRHPDWCAKDHRCSHAEHRSVPARVQYGRLSVVVSIVGAHGRAPATELIVSVRLAGRTAVAQSREAARVASTVVCAVLKEINR